MSIEDRLETLERDLNRTRRNIRRLLSGIGFVIGALILGWALGAVPSAAQDGEKKIVRAHGFVLEDKAGRSRAELVIDRMTRPVLRLKDKSGESRLDLVATPGGAWLSMNGEKGTGGALTLSTVSGASGIYEIFEAGLSLYDEKGIARAVLKTVREGPELVLRDEKGAIRAGLAVFPDGRPVLTLYDEDINPIWEAP